MSDRPANVAGAQPSSRSTNVVLRAVNTMPARGITKKRKQTSQTFGALSRHWLITHTAAVVKPASISGSVARIQALITIDGRCVASACARDHEEAEADIPNFWCSEPALVDNTHGGGGQGQSRI
ncbi:hypothetical protein NEOLEDRAFT_1167671 [Neolentinus lepideus HHB14362 ss-1]|uniref:Uncharacterized protein n=1 Tax=Neolentinus lepideus HHB14362 ss-1 TaxID=1314782 RepID=A0A165UMH2_9AGAM|nr:hypothetical protein NEOLEDRAFT_1167671 [Neolentinus lepideus HHB14362 ss-1]